MTATRPPASPAIQVEYVVPSAITDGTGLADADVPASLADARVAVPSVVDPWDVASPEPDLLAALKATTVPPPIPVPGHWRQKRKYLQNKRGLAKAPFELPPYVAATGIGGLRDAAADAATEKSMKRIGRERIRPKVGAGGVPAKVLRDAFLVHATKPRLTPMGDLYYELRETEGGGGGDGGSGRRPVPGELSADLRAALGMPPDGVHPPPWLRAMQQYGPPPAYPTLRLPGVNAPLPPGGLRKGGPTAAAAGAVEADADGAGGGGGGGDGDAAPHPPPPASSLYTVLPAVASRTADGALLGTSHVYAVGDAVAPSAAGGPPAGPPPGGAAERRAASRKRKADEAADEAAARQAAAAEAARQKSFKF
ncbi:hypothetical protein I4F81_006899 [Pyropia yezoensis]|uniref:Uncharacterized protein n=1 Tax=Pyropia yezoensis TaxID=2788 RepID=A0ACC3C2Z6_PYRYE|nr:hypothetical protein I4F81_006899 [Neopyropia yezoensis]